MTNRRISISVLTLALVFGLVVLLVSTPAVAQKKGHKEAEKFKGQTTATRTSVEKARDQLQQTMQLYNQLFETEGKKLNSVYGKLSKAVEGCDKAAKDVNKSVEGMTKQAERFFGGWEAEIESISSPEIQEKSRGRLEKARGRYDGMLASMDEAGDLYEPFILNLREQVMYLGRDLDAEVLGDLKDEAAQMNASADELFAKIEQILTGEVEGEKEVDEIVAEDEAEVGAEGEGQAPAEGEGEAAGEGETEPGLGDGNSES